MSDQPARVGFTSHPDCGRHDTGWGHPEHQGRLPAVVRAIERDTPALLPYILQREAVPVREDALQLAHTAGHVRTVRDAGEVAAAGNEIVMLDPDTAVSPA